MRKSSSNAREGDESYFGSAGLGKKMPKIILKKETRKSHRTRRVANQSLLCSNVNKIEEGSQQHSSPIKSRCLRKQGKHPRNKVPEKNTYGEIPVMPVMQTIDKPLTNPSNFAMSNSSYNQQDPESKNASHDSAGTFPYLI